MVMPMYHESKISSHGYENSVVSAGDIDGLDNELSVLALGT
jgi:hypothetical protein